MKKANIIIVLLAGSLTAMAQTAEEPMAQVVERGLQRATSQSLILADAMKERKDALPRTFERSRGAQEPSLQTVRYDHWVSGFFPGVLWLLYEDRGDANLRRYAEMYTDRVEPAKRVTNTHDLGFILYCSFGQGYRLTGNKHYLDVISEGTQSLLTRWNDKQGVIKSWESGPKWQYPVIIDNMMNLEMLCFMTRETGNRRLWVETLDRIARPVLENLAAGTLKKNMPFESLSSDPFWAAPARDWTAKKAWNGEDVGADHAIR